MANLSHWDAAETFSGGEAAALVVGVDISDPNAETWKANAVLARMTEGHRVARACISHTFTVDEFKIQRRYLTDGLFSVLFDLYPVLQKVNWPSDTSRIYEFPNRIGGAEGEFSAQRFTRAELHRWLCDVGIKSVYQFLPESTGAIDPSVQPEKPLTTRERNNMLTTIAALCKEAKLDYRTPAKTAGLIRGVMAGMGVDVGETTIEGYLKKIPDVLESRAK